MDGVEHVPESEGEFPAYAAWGHTCDQNNSAYELQCASAGEFCFLCEFENGGCPDDTGDDLRADVAKLIVGMLKSKAEPSTIARRVHAVYEENIRTHVDYTRASGMAVCAPEWTLKSIERHLMFATEFSGIFNAWLTRSYQSMLVHMGNKLITADGRVCGIASKQFTTTAKSYVDIRKALAQLENAP